MLCSIIAGGHVLIEDIPGVGKTTLALAFSKATGLSHNRIQCTPDLMPNDIMGFYMYRKGTDSFELVEGAVMCNLLLADEINRTSTRTQSALLEVMEEGRVTIDMHDFETPRPFTVIATQNPVGYTGTQMLPESQLDRFIMCLRMGYAEAADEMEIIKLKTGAASSAFGFDSANVRPVASADDILNMQKAALAVHADDSLYRYIVDLVTATRRHASVELGASPRAGISLMRCAKALALMSGRDFVIPEDILEVYYPVMAHRLVLKSSASENSNAQRLILTEILRQVDRPSMAQS